MKPGGMSRAPSGLEIKSTDGTVEVKDFARKEKTRMLAALHVLKVHFTQGDTTRSYFGLRITSRTMDRYGAALERFEDLNSEFARKFGHMGIVHGTEPIEDGYG